MNDWKHKLLLRLPAMLLLAATLLFWGRYDRYESAGPILLQSPVLSDAMRVRGECSEYNGGFLLNVESGGKRASINFPVPDGTIYDLIRVRGNIKVDHVVAGRHDWDCARLLLVQYDENNRWISGHHSAVAVDGTRDWTPYEDVFEVNALAERVDLVIQQIGKSGSAAFGGLVVEPVRLRASFIFWQGAYGVLWVAMGMLYFRRCRLHRRKLRLLIVLNALAIIFGTMMPEKWIEGTTDFAKEEAAKVVDATRAKNASPSTKPPATRPDDHTIMEQFSELVGSAHSAGHFCLFASLCFLVYLSAMLEGQHRSYFFKVAFDILLFAAITESLQFLTTDRTPGIHDWFIDFLGMVMAFAIFLTVLGMRRLQRGNAVSSSSL